MKKKQTPRSTFKLNTETRKQTSILKYIKCKKEDDSLPSLNFFKGISDQTSMQTNSDEQTRNSLKKKK